MPSEPENINYLYLVLTNDGNPTIDWDAVSATLDLKKSAVTKRWSRLKQAMEQNQVPGGSTYQFLWLCVKHHTRTQPPNWIDIAAKANTTSGAASKRYSRMKKVFEENNTAPSPSSPLKNTPGKAGNTSKSTVKKSRKTATSSGNDVDDTQTMPTTKRKRGSPKAKVAAAKDEAKFKPDPENEDDEEELLESKPKRPKIGKNNIKVTPKPKPKGIVKKEEASEDGEDAFFDAQEDLTRQGKAGEVGHDSYAVHDPDPADSLDLSGEFI